MPEEYGARSPAQVRRWRRALADEREEARIYLELAARRTGEEREVLLGLAEAEKRHAAYWEELLGDDEGEPRRGALRLRLLAWLAGRFGWVFVLALMQQAEARSYQEADAEVPAVISADERIHGEVVRGLGARGRAQMSGTLRAAVFGANDGMVSNLALVLGVIGGGATAQAVLLTGMAGLLAGALSMAAGEYISVSSQRELLAASKPDRSARSSVGELDVDENELALVYRARGMPVEEAERVANEMLHKRRIERVPGQAEQDGTEVVGSGLQAAASSFAFFAVGALLPVLPFAIGLSGTLAVVAAGVITGAGLMLTGGAVGVLTGASPLWRALRQFAIGFGAALATYLLGLAFGAILG
ncbi:rubrerythrin family protein [Allosaccharopolyspora coralli]|uniref:Rubrerythrin family protein n=1 Tax=Allosaccharopolyspora coralli TaxID=2665642 RepID=A0A5Q3Q3D7_9PSEU|nr:VIT1/CCC1 family protein [Allosaccharopolyspora coralli]QGK69118.1 rubrerythrin family protein [Allosaccharopolyspora coralli]